MLLIRPFPFKELSFVYLGVDHLTFEGDMGGSVKARRIFFRKPLDCFQALYVIRVFFSAGKFFPKVFPCKSFFFPSNPVYGNIIHIPSPQKSNGMIAGSDL